MGWEGRNHRWFSVGMLAIILVTLGGVTAGVASTAPTSNLEKPDIADVKAIPDELVVDTRQTVAPDSSFGELYAAVAEAGSVRVIVNLQMYWAPEPLLGDIARANQSATIAAQQDGVMASLAGTDYRVSHRYSFIPYMALELGEDAVRALEASGLAAAIQVDTADPIALGDSIPLINADDAWASGYEGTGQVVAVLDTGVDGGHSFLAGKVVEEACFSLGSDCPNGSTIQLGTGAGVNCTYSGSCDHGTHVAGIAAGFASPGDSGVARDADVMAVQVFTRFDDAGSCGSAPIPCALSYTSDQLAGLERVYAVRGSHTIASVNMSIGGSTPYTSACDSDSRKSAIDNLLAAGIATVISSGNSGYDTAVGSPGCISSAITVASSTKADTRSSFSNTAPIVDVIAPGSDIYSSVPGGGFAFKSGTSMAAPHVAGAWAVIKEAFPTASVSDIETALENSAPLIQVRSGPDESLPRIDITAALAAIVISAPANDDFSAAETVGAPDSVATSTVGATTEASEPLTCSDLEVGLSPFGATIWYSLTPTDDLDVTIDTAGSGFDTVLGVYTGSQLASLTQVVCDDDYLGMTTDSFVEFVALDGVTYWVQVGGYGTPGAEGDLALAITGTVRDSDPPVWPGGGSLVVSDVFSDRATVDWSAATDVSGIADYRVYLDGTLVATKSGRSHEFSGLAHMTTYDVRIEAGDTNGNWTTNGPTGTWTTAQDFLDTDGHVFEQDIEWLSGAAITAGCNPPLNDRFCPNDFVTRGQMAAFLVRALGLTDDGGGNLFVDDDGSIFEASIDKLGTAGVTRGCNPPVNDMFCPNDFVTRGQMAAFLVRAVGYTDNGGGNLFTDDDGSVFEDAIDKLGTAGVTRGCNPPTNDRYCPNDLVTRGQMAAFLRRALG